uniref:Uncharacterized protein n=1 Tax=Geospiza parvula TaxID=87175 RepID=A0A8U8C3L3_GEOPR
LLLVVFFFIIFLLVFVLLLWDTPCDLPQIENGNLPQYYYSFRRYYFPMDKGKKLSYSCVVGYTTESGTQDGRITCTTKGWSPVPRCYRKCTKPLLENGSFYSTEMDFKIHEKLQYKCNPGYLTPSGAAEDTVQCQPQGWSFQPSCTKTLGSVPRLEHGSAAGAAREVRRNGTLRYRCQPGFRTAAGSAAATALCLPHGWDLPPRCTRITCSALSEVAHGGFYPVKKTYEEGDVVHFFCDKHYSVTGSDLIQCYNFGWYPDPPVCEDVKNKCPPPPLPHGHVSTARRTYHNGDKVHVQCTLGRRGSEEIQCEGGKWTSPSICIVSAMVTGAVDNQESGTAPPPLEADAETGANQSHHNEDMSRFNCLSLYPISEVQQDCASPPVVKNGAVLGPVLASYKSGSWVEYVCQHYHFLDGPSTVYCHQGNWTEQPTCLEKCGSPPSIANGALTVPALPHYDSGSSVQYICSDYHFLQGSEKIYCSEGQWTSPPVCIEPCTLSKTEMEKNNVLLQAFYADQVYFYHGDYVGFYCKQNHFGAESGTTLFQVQCDRGQLAYPRCVEREKQVWT